MIEYTKGNMIAETYPAISPDWNIKVDNGDGTFIHIAIIGDYEGNAKANAERLALCWNSHDALLEEVK